MGDTCLPGLQGFPVQITGWSSLTDTASITAPNDIQLQFSPAEVPMAFNRQTGEITTNGTSTFFTGGTQYNVRIVRLSRPKQEGLAGFSGDAFAEFQIWGTPTATSVAAKSDLAVLIIPVIQKPTENAAGQAITDAVTGNSVKLIRTIPEGSGVDVIKYTTCVETDTNRTINISVAYWSTGASITQDMARRIAPAGTNLAPAGIPNILGFKLLSSFTQFNDEARTKGNRVYNQEAGINQPYMSMITLSATSPEFQTGFRLIRNFDQKKVSSRDTSEYKCIAIDRGRDIKDGQLLIDPKTGERMDNEIQKANDQDKDTLSPPTATIGAGDIWIRVCIVIGVILGITLLAGLIYGVHYFFFAKKYLGYAPTVGTSVGTSVGASIGTSVGTAVGTAVGKSGDKLDIVDTIITIVIVILFIAVILLFGTPARGISPGRKGYLQ